MNPRPQNPSAHLRLSREWTAAGIVGCTLLVAGCAGLSIQLEPGAGLIWLLVSAAVLGGQMAWVRNRLYLNQRPDGAMMASLGPANRVTLLRGLLIAGISGFVFLPGSTATVEFLNWAPALSFFLASGLDLVDGWIARRTDTMTDLGQALDTEFDALAILTGGVLALRWGKVDSWFLLVGLAYYLFRLGCRLRRRRGLPTGPLPPSRIRRPLAGCAMAVTGAVLLPPISAEIGRILTLIVTIPFLANFLSDYLAVSRGRPVNPPRRAGRAETDGFSAQSGPSRGMSRTGGGHSG